MRQSLTPLLIVIAMIALFAAQCTLTHRWLVNDVRMELLPSLLLYAAFTVNLPIGILLSLVAATLYDSFSAGPFGGSMIPYAATVALFCALRPIFFRNRISTQIITGFVFSWIVLFLQWGLSGKALLTWHTILPKLLRLSLVSSALAVFYFAIMDTFVKGLGQEPGRFNEEL
jgi:cell shape-determining protein MreD